MVNVMKKMKLLLIGFVVAMFALCGCSKNEEADNQTDDVEEVPTRVELTNMESAAYLQYTDNTTTVTLVDYDGVWYFEGDMETWVDQAKAYEIVEAASDLTSVDDVDDAGALADYGLETPAYTVIVKDSEGTAVTIYIGNALEDGTYYATTDEKEAVYIISSQLVNRLEFNTGLLIEIVEEEYTDEEYLEEETYEEDITDEYVEEEDTPIIEEEEEYIEEDSSSESEE